MDTNVKEIIDLINNYWATITVVLGFLGIGIEKSKWIKFNPYSSLFKWIGKQVNSEMKQELDDIQNKVSSLSNEFENHVISSDEKEFKRVRAEILSFGNSIMKGENRDMNQYRHIIDLYNEDYKRLEELHNFKNGYCDEMYNFIMEKFRENQRNNSFLK